MLKYAGQGDLLSVFRAAAVTFTIHTTNFLQHLPWPVTGVGMESFGTLTQRKGGCVAVMSLLYIPADPKTCPTDLDWVARLCD